MLCAHVGNLFGLQSKTTVNSCLYFRGFWNQWSVIVKTLWHFSYRLFKFEPGTSYGCRPSEVANQLHLFSCPDLLISRELQKLWRRTCMALSKHGFIFNTLMENSYSVFSLSVCMLSVFCKTAYLTRTCLCTWPSGQIFLGLYGYVRDNGRVILPCLAGAGFFFILASSAEESEHVLT